jgi:hypothetical protein
MPRMSSIWLKEENMCKRAQILETPWKNNFAIPRYASSLQSGNPCMGGCDDQRHHTGALANAVRAPQTPQPLKRQRHYYPWIWRREELQSAHHWEGLSAVGEVALGREGSISYRDSLQLLDKGVRLSYPGTYQRPSIITPYQRLRSGRCS